MNASERKEFVRRAEGFYQKNLRAKLEQSQMNQFVAIEPESGDYFLGKTLTEAAQAARKAHPDRPSHLMRVGHVAAVHIGGGGS